MQTILLALSLLLYTDDVDFGAFNYDRPNFSAFDYAIKKESLPPPAIKKAEIPPPFFPAQILPNHVWGPAPKVKKPVEPEVKYFKAVDKFGDWYRHVDKNVLDKFIDERNKEPFKAVDKFGQTWTHNDKTVLDEFIKRQNDYYDSLYNNHQSQYNSFCNNQFFTGYT